MKSEALQMWLKRHAEVLAVAGAHEAAADLSAFAAIFGLRPKATVGAVLKALQSVDYSGVTGAGNTDKLSAILGLMVKSVEGIAKAGDAKGLELVSEFVSSHRTLPLEPFVARLTDTLKSPPPTKKSKTAAPSLCDAGIRNYVSRLETALGDDPGFKEVYSELTSDERVKAADAKKIAKSFAGKAGSSKADALGRIYARHSALMSARPKADAIGGRLAS